MIKKYWRKKLVACAALLWACSIGVSPALVIEDWSDEGDAEGWIARDGIFSVAWNSAGSDGNLGGSLGGTFAEQSMPIPETDAWRAGAAASEGWFVGDYIERTITSLTFDFHTSSQYLIPSDFMIRLSGAGYTFTKNLKPQIGLCGGWSEITAEMNYSGWFGGTLENFQDTLHDVEWIEIQITRYGTTSQTYLIDNFKLNGITIDLADSLSGWFILSGLAFVFVSRRRK